MESIYFRYLEYIIVGLLLAILVNVSRLYGRDRVKRIHDRPPPQLSNNLKPVPDDLLACLSHKMRPLPMKSFTLRHLAKYKGHIHEENLDNPVYVAVSGIVYDVSSSRALYGVDGPRASFAGRDITVALAKGNMDLAGAKLEDSTLSEIEMTNLRKWEKKFIYEYEAVGLLRGPLAG